MELSIFIAKIIAVLYISAAIGFIINETNYKKLFDSFVNNPAISYLGGVMALIIGFLMVQYHNVWSGEWWVVIITLFGWLSLLKGITLIAFPKFITLFEFLFKNKVIKIFPYIAIAIGLVFGYFGFIA